MQAANITTALTLPDKRIVRNLGIVRGITVRSRALGGQIAASGWTIPVKAMVGSGFRTASRPTHQGVDLIVGRYTPIAAVASGGLTKPIPMPARMNPGRSVVQSSLGLMPCISTRARPISARPAVRNRRTE